MSYDDLVVHLDKSIPKSDLSVLCRFGIVSLALCIISYRIITYCYKFRCQNFDPRWIATLKLACWQCLMWKAKTGELATRHGTLFDLEVGAWSFRRIGILPIAILSTFHFFQLVIMSMCSFYNSTFFQLDMWSSWHFVNLTFCQLAIFST
jgi:hypothetical protein